MQNISRLQTTTQPVRHLFVILVYGLAALRAPRRPPQGTNVRDVIMNFEKGQACQQIDKT